MRIRAATLAELLDEPSIPPISPTADRRCWCARPGGCDEQLPAGAPGRLCEVCATHDHPRVDPAQLARRAP